MNQEPAVQRFHLAQKLLNLKQAVAEAITHEFFILHPEWADRYGERGRQHCTADACFHIEFLAGAIEAASPEAFADYARWTARMLGARGIGAHRLEEHFAQLERRLCAVLLPAEQEAVSTFLARGRQVCAEPQAALDTHSDFNPLGLTQEAYLAAILAGDRHAALGIVEEALHANHTHLEIYVDVLSRSLHRIGELWEMNRISVAQEHMATAITQYVIAAIYPRLVSTDAHRGAMVVTGVSGEQHQIGANLVADAMESKGWGVRFLGTNLPHASVLATVEEASADVLCISTTVVSNLPSVAELIQLVHNKLGQRAPRIVLGGAAYRIAPQFARDVGSGEALTDLRQAISTLCA
jgi:methanogenic corrinoid protein MtbC1